MQFGAVIYNRSNLSLAWSAGRKRLATIIIWATLIRSVFNPSAMNAMESAVAAEANIAENRRRCPMALVRECRRRSRPTPKKVVQIPIIVARTYALRNIETGNLVYYHCKRRDERVVEKFMTKVEAQLWALNTIGAQALDFVEPVQLNKAGGIIE